MKLLARKVREFERSSIRDNYTLIPEWHRDRIQQKYGMPIEAWEAKTGKKLEEGLYKGTVRRGGHAPGCGCSAGGETPIQPITGT